jgi:hypothetical protein
VTDHLSETVLRDLGAHLDVPPPPPADALASAVLARLDEPAPRRRVALPPTLLPRLAAAVIALLVALGVAMAVSPQVRAAVLEFLRIGGVELNQGPPPTTPTDTGIRFPGERAVTLDEAHDIANFPIRLPTALGDPTAVYLLDGRVVSLHYDSPRHGVVRVDEFEGGMTPLFQKYVHADDAVPTRVDGWQGVWLPRPHPVLYLGQDGNVHEQAPRLAGSTLIWEQGGLTYRVEGDLSRAEAAAIAESIPG